MGRARNHLLASRSLPKHRGSPAHASDGRATARIRSAVFAGLPTDCHTGLSSFGEMSRTKTGIVQGRLLAYEQYSSDSLWQGA